MENIFVFDNTNMHMILVTGIYNYDITTINKNNYSMHFGGILAFKEALSYIRDFFAIIIGNIKWFGYVLGSIAQIL